MLSQQTEIINKLGLHARAAAKLVETANRYASRITLQCLDNQADAKSIMSVMMLAASQGTIIDITAQGKDQQQAMDAIIALIEDYFGEDE